MARRLSLFVFLSLLVTPTLLADDYLVLFKGSGIPAGFAAQVAALGGTVTSQHEAGIAAVTGLTADGAATLASATGVADVEPDATVTLVPAAIADAEAAYGEPAVQSATNPAGAFFYARQWDMRAIGANLGWAAGRLGSSDVTVAILDTGIDYRHADLAGRVDLSRSVSFVPTDDALVATYFPTRNKVTDLHYHGTHVAATVASNAIAAAGMTSKVTLIGVKVLNVSGSGSFSAILNGVLWAADHGADVANMSLGGGFDRAHNGNFIGFYNRVFNYANAKGTLVVVAAGNDAFDLDHTPNYFAANCDAPNVVCVSATGPTFTASTNGPWTDADTPAFYTNYGRSAINVAAPGGNQGPSPDKGGFVYEACSTSSLQIPVCQTGTYIIGLMGTSQATPHVAGLAALIVEQVGHGHPSQVKARLQQSADDLGQPGTDPYYGKGRINVPRAEGLQ